MTDREIDEMIVRIHQMAAVASSEFVVDLAKLEAFRRAQKARGDNP